MKIKCITVDDEPLALQKMSGYIKQVGYLIHLAEFDNALEAIEFMKKHEIDLVFLDIQMDELTGIQMLEAMSNPPKIIFTTAYSEYAIKGYELNVSDYLLKPIPFTRFLQSCEKVYQQLESKDSQEKDNNTKSNIIDAGDYFFVKNGTITQKIIISEILFVEGMKDYLRIHTEKEEIMTLLSFKKIEETLRPPKFSRIHKSFLISVDKISSIKKNRVNIEKHTLPIGESYRKKFFEIVDKKRLVN